MTVIEVNINDSDVLTNITKRSKAYWGYSDEQMNKWSELLTITQKYIETNNVFKLLIDNRTVGYYSFFYEKESTIKLDNLFVLPEFIGNGLGKLLMNDFLTRIKGTEAKKILLDSEPNAESFYAKFGFIKVGQIETSIHDRYLPVMELKLNS